MGRFPADGGSGLHLQENCLALCLPIFQVEICLETVTAQGLHSHLPCFFVYFFLDVMKAGSVTAHGAP